MPMDQFVSKQVLDHLNGRVPMVMPTGHRLRLLTVVGDADTAGTEVAAGGGYVSGSGAPLVVWGDADLATPALAETTASITITSWPRVEDVVGGEIWSDAPQRLSYAAFGAPIPMGIGDTLTLAPGDISGEMQ